VLELCPYVLQDASTHVFTCVSPEVVGNVVYEFGVAAVEQRLAEMHARCRSSGDDLCHRLGSSGIPVV